MDDRDILESQTYQVTNPACKRRVRGKAKIVEKTIDIPIEQVKDLNISPTEQGAEMSYTSAKKLRPKKIMTPLQKENWNKVLEQNAIKRRDYQEYKLALLEQDALKKAKQLVEENKVSIVVKPKQARKNPNHPLQTMKGSFPGPRTFHVLFFPGRGNHIFLDGALDFKNT